MLIQRILISFFGTKLLMKSGFFCFLMLPLSNSCSKFQSQAHYPTGCA